MRRRVPSCCVFLAGAQLTLAVMLSPASVRAAEIETPAPLPALQPSEARPVKIAVGVWLADVTRIDSVAQTFSANLGLVLRWHDARLAHADAGTRRYRLEDVWHPAWLIGNDDGGLERSLPEVVDVTAAGDVVYRQRLVGSFSQALDLRAFPFDHDTFRIHIIVPGYSPDDIQFVPDPRFVAEGFADGAGVAPKLTVQEWRVTADSTRDLPYVAGPGLTIAGYAFEFVAYRNARHFIVKVIIPLVLIVMMSWAVFWIEPTNSGSQISLAVTTVLTLIAYRFAVDAEVPKLPYTTRLDAFILASTLLVFGSLVEVIVTTNLAEHGRVDFARAVDRRSRVIVPIVFVILSAICFLYWPPRALTANTGP